MLTFVITGPLRELAGNRDAVRIDARAASVDEALALLWRECPAFRDRVVTEVGELRTHLNVFVDGENIKYLRGFATPLASDAEITILPAISGG